MLDADITIYGGESHARGMLLTWVRKLERECGKQQYFTTGWECLKDCIKMVPIYDAPIPAGFYRPDGGYGSAEIYDKE